MSDISATSWATPISTPSFTPAEQLANLESTSTAEALGLPGPTAPIANAPSGVVFTPSEELLALQAQTDGEALSLAGPTLSGVDPSSLFSTFNAYSLYDSTGTTSALPQ